LFTIQVRPVPCPCWVPTRNRCLMYQARSVSPAGGHHPAGRARSWGRLGRRTATAATGVVACCGEPDPPVVPVPPEPPTRCAADRVAGVRAVPSTAGEATTARGESSAGRSSVTAGLIGRHDGNSKDLPPQHLLRPLTAGGEPSRNRRTSTRSEVPRTPPVPGSLPSRVTGPGWPEAVVVPLIRGAKTPLWQWSRLGR